MERWSDGLGSKFLSFLIQFIPTDLYRPVPRRRDGVDHYSQRGGLASVNSLFIIIFIFILTTQYIPRDHHIETCLRSQLESTGARSESRWYAFSTFRHQVPSSLFISRSSYIHMRTMRHRHRSSSQFALIAIYQQTI